MKARQCFERLCGAALGCMCGDALGMPVEGWRPETIQANYGIVNDMFEGRLPAGSYTDDSQMMIAILESLEACGGRFDPADLGRCFAEKFQPWRGYGGRIAGVMKRLTSGAMWNEAGTDSFGNGGAMRVGVLGVLFANDSDALLQAALDQCRITHHHPQSLAGAAAQALAVGLACRLADNNAAIIQEEFIGYLTKNAATIDTHVTDRLQAMPKLRGLSFGEARDALTGEYACDVTAAEAVPPAIGAFIWAAEGRAVKDAIILAVNLGGDTDTIGAMTGALAGAYWGVQYIPPIWVQTLENGNGGKDRVITLCRRLCEQLPIDETPVY